VVYHDRYQLYYFNTYRRRRFKLMCLAVLVKPGGVFTEEQAAEAFKCNSDGAGFAFVNNSGDISLYKGYMKFSDFWEAFKGATESGGKDPESPIAIHFRIATAGRVEKDNCHPFLFNDGTAVAAHNGCLWHGSRADEKSDTREFVEMVSPFLTEERVADPEKLRKVGHAVAGNKIVLLYKSKNFAIINESQGHWDEKQLVWYSNHSYKVWRSTMNSTSGYPTGSPYDMRRYDRHAGWE
jgi:hypothetical protein